MKSAKVSESIKLVSYRKQVTTKTISKDKVQVSHRATVAEKSRKVAAAGVGDIDRKPKKAAPKSQKKRSD